MRPGMAVALKLSWQLAVTEQMQLMAETLNFI